MTLTTALPHYCLGAGWLILALCSPAAQAVDNSPTARLTRLADCINAAGDIKGTRRESFMNACLAAKARAAGDPATQQLLAPAVASSAPSSGLPPQERILACAAASRNMRGTQRTAYLKDCLAGRASVPRAATKLAQRKSVCLAQAKGQAGTQGLAFLDTCLAASGDAAPAVVNTGSASTLAQERGSRRRAACNVMAGEKRGEQRDAFIQRCVLASPTARPTSRP